MPNDLIEPTSTAAAPTVAADLTARRTAVLAAADRATRRIAPLWELEGFVAVNPYVGLTDLSFADATARLQAAAGTRSALDPAVYLAALDEGRMVPADVESVLAAGGAGATAASVITAARSGADPVATPSPVATVAEVAAEVTGTDWSAYLVDRVGAWAAAYFDAGQASWRSADPAAGPYASWREEAGVDRSPEIAGLAGFRTQVRALPADRDDAIAAAVAELGLDGAALDLHLHALLLRLGGWAGFAARRRFEAERDGGHDDCPLDLLAVLLSWEVLLLRTVPAPAVRAAWSAEVARTDTVAAGLAQRVGRPVDAVLQDAFDRAASRRLVERFADGSPTSPRTERARAQVVFCIDVRSEVFRRHLEAEAPDVETLGFAGFFGVPIEVVPLGHDRGVEQCPVLLRPGHVLAEGIDDPALERAAIERRQRTHFVARSWKAFKMGAVSCFSFVGPVGLAYLPKLFTDGFGRSRPTRPAEVEGLTPEMARRLVPLLDGRPDRPDTGIPLDPRTDIAAAVLGAMSLTRNFAPLVVLTGHGASTVNNPYDKGLDCGACGGHTGEANARVTAAILNHPKVRAGLAQRGIVVPDDTWFVAAQHDTTTDEITIFDRHLIPAGHVAAVVGLEQSFVAAGRRTRRERGRRMGIPTDTLDHDAVDRAVIARSRDWSEVRPEWGLAGCHSFIAAPRHRTAHLDLGGRTFLHSYDWRADDTFGVLELIMTAPMVVASWINLQYFGSTVDNERFGSGNKTLHNVVGRIGVLEGTGGDLRSGLPWQSVHDGTDYQHEPLRLSVVIEAPTAAMNDVVRAHPGIRQLLDGNWLTLFAMDDDGRIAQRYAGDLTWVPADLPANHLPLERSAS